MLDFHAQIERERKRRDRAIVRLEHGVERVTDGLAQKVVSGAGELVESAGVGMVKGVIRSSPWAACFASLSAGALLGRIATSGGSSTGCTQSEPQRVIVEVQHNNVAAAPAQAPVAAPKLSIMDLLMQGLTVYGAVQRSIQEMQAMQAAEAEQQAQAAAAGQTEQNIPPANNV